MKPSLGTLLSHLVCSTLKSYSPQHCTSTLSWTRVLVNKLQIRACITFRCLCFMSVLIMVPLVIHVSMVRGQWIGVTPRHWEKQKLHTEIWTRIHLFAELLCFRWTWNPSSWWRDILVRFPISLLHTCWSCKFPMLLGILCSYRVT
jgi:hypothetical protein